MRLCHSEGLVHSIIPAVVLLLVQSSFSQTFGPLEPMRLHVDYARFRGDEKNMFVEIYYSFPEGSITYKWEAEEFKGGAEITAIVMQKDSMVYGDRWLVPHVVKDTTTLRSGMNLVGLTGVGLPEGEYLLKVIGKDRNNLMRQDSVSMRLPVKMLGQDRMQISDVELASNIRTQGNKTSPFYKNTLEVIPSPEGLFSEDQKCFYYAEAYNLLGPGVGREYFVKMVVYDAAGHEVVSRERERKPVAESTVLVDNLAIGQMKSGTYSLLIGLLDTTKKVISSTGRKFFVYNRKLGTDSTLFLSATSGSFGEYAGVEETELDREFDWARYEATDVEKAQFKKLKSVDAKRKYLSDFWHKRPLGFKEEYLKRVAHANSAFPVLGRPGYKTDRGRVYIMYGPPDDYERHPNESDLRPYEIWTFESIQGGVIFVFVQRTSGGDFELVHSTHRNELHDENWQQYIQTH